MNKKQINRKADELVTAIRQYQRGYTKAFMVKNTLECLFTDILLADNKHMKCEEIGEKGGLLNIQFDRLLEEMKHG